MTRTIPTAEPLEKGERTSRRPSSFFLPSRRPLAYEEREKCRLVIIHVLLLLYVHTHMCVYVCVCVCVPGTSRSHLASAPLLNEGRVFASNEQLLVLGGPWRVFGLDACLLVFYPPERFGFYFYTGRLRGGREVVRVDVAGSLSCKFRNDRGCFCMVDGGAIFILLNLIVSNFTPAILTV